MMALEQADIFLVVAEWPSKRIDHWNTLLKARAIENQVFLAAVNCAGKSGNETYGGNSSIISPWGEVLASSGTKDQALISLEIDLSTIPEYRKNINILEDRRTDLY
jgi:predicted amidohydrolase